MKKILLFFVCFFFIVSIAEAVTQGKAVFIKGTEIWIVNEDGSNLKQLTNDGIDKRSPVWSPDGSNIVYYLEFKYSNPVATIKTIDNAGKEIRKFNVAAKGEEPVSIRYIIGLDWIDNARLGIEGSIDPCMDEYRIIDVNSGQTIKSYYGAKFSWSPDKKKNAMRGWYPQDAPPEVKSDYLKIEESRIYPSKEDREQERLQKIIHEFQSWIFWSAAGERLAFVEEIEKGTERNKYLTTVFSATNTLKKITLPSEVANVVSILWSDDKRYVYLIAKDKSGAKGWEVDSETSKITQLSIDAIKLKLPAYAKEFDREKLIDGLGGGVADWFPQ